MSYIWDKCLNMEVYEKEIIQNMEHHLSNLAEEPAMQYGVSTSPQLERLSDFFSNKMWMILTIRQGVSYRLFDAIQKYTPFSEMDWATFLNLSTKSLQRYKKDKTRFKPLHSEKIIELAEVTQIGLEVFDSIDQFKLWLDTPSFALGNIKPIELLRDSYGKEMVVAELIRIDHGIFV